MGGAAARVGWASCRRGEGDLTTAVGSQQVSQSDGDVMTTVTYRYRYSSVFHSMYQSI